MFAQATSCQGKAISNLPFSRPRRMRRAASSDEMMYGIGNLLTLVMGVST